VELFESREHPGYYHYALHRIGDDFCDESRRPVKASFLQDNLSRLFRPAVPADLYWQETPTAELVFSEERVRAGV
jgi:hypothetical protein